MRAAVVGTHWGRVHVAALREAGVEVVALAGADVGEVRASAAELSIPTATTDLAALAGLDLGLVSVATPAPTHAAVIEALPDVPVLCEKPAVGLAPARPLAPRAAPVWVNYAFAFLEVAQRAAAATPRIGPITGASVTSGHDLPELALGPEAMLLELVPHPWSWLVTLLGPAAVAAAVAPAVAPSPSPPPDRSEATTLAVRCGPVRVTLTSRHEPGLDGLRHEVLLHGEHGRLAVSGRYRRGQWWWFDPPALMVDGAAAEPLGGPEPARDDPWYRANAHAIGAVVATLRGAPPDPRLFDWDRALAMDRAIQAALGST